MSSATVILEGTDGAPLFRWVARDTGKAATGSAAEVAAAFPDAAAITVLLSSAHVLLTEVSVKARNRRLLDNAVSYVLEDQLAQDVDDLLFDVGPAIREDTYPVAVADRALIESIDAVFTAAGFDAVRCVPYVMALPLESDRHTLLNDGVLAVVRSGAYCGFTAPMDAAAALLERSEREAGETLSRSHYVLGDREPGLAGQPGARVIPTGTCADWLDGNISASSNLGFAVTAAAGPPALERKLAGAGALLLAALVVHTGFVYSRTAENEERIAVAEIATQKTFNAAFPEVNRIVNPKVQAERLLTALRDDQPRGLTFLDGMHALGSAVTALGDGTTLKSVRYLGGRFDLALDTPDLAALEKLRTALAAHDISVEIVSAENRNDRVVGRLQFEQSSQ